MYKKTIGLIHIDGRLQRKRIHLKISKKGQNDLCFRTPTML